LRKLTPAMDQIRIFLGSLANRLIPPSLIRVKVRGDKLFFANQNMAQSGAKLPSPDGEGRGLRGQVGSGRLAENRTFPWISLRNCTVYHVTPMVHKAVYVMPSPTPCLCISTTPQLPSNLHVASGKDAGCCGASADDGADESCGGTWSTCPTIALTATWLSGNEVGTEAGDVSRALYWC
jgi:hypothetical protein